MLIKDLLDEKREGWTFDKVLAVMTKDPRELDLKIDDNRKAYDGDHAILHDPRRQPKTLGEGTAAREVDYTREVLQFQKRIVGSAVTFLFGDPVKLVLNDDGDEDAFQRVEDVWRRNKLAFIDKIIARDLFVECKVAELWYIPQKELGKPARTRVAVLSKRTGYSIYPHFDEYGDMDAFTAKYKTQDDQDKPVQNVDIYTSDVIINAIKPESQGWTTTSVKNMLGKIPVVYYEQQEPEWEPVKTEINRAEKLICNFGDTNDYFGSPVLQVKGTVTNLPRKEDSGKVVTVASETDDQGKVYYPGGIEFVTWEQGPEAVEKEYALLKDIIYGLTSTPDLSFSNVKGMTQLSGIALRLMFSDALFKAKDKQEIFGPAMDRRLSIVKDMLGVISFKDTAAIQALVIDFEFGDVLPEDVTAMVEALSVARAGQPIMSQESAVRQNSLVTNPEDDLKALEAEDRQVKSLAESYA